MAWPYDTNNNSTYGSGVINGSFSGSNAFGTPYATNNSYGGGGGNNLLATSGTATDSSGGWRPSDYLTAAQLILGQINQNKADKRSSQPPKFAQVPLTPNEQKLWDMYMAQQTGPTSHNRELVSGVAQDMLHNMHPTWTPPATSTGETGYNGTAGMQFPQIPAFDWSGYTQRTTNPSPASPSTPRPGSGPQSIIPGSGNPKDSSGPFDKSFVSDEDVLGNRGGGGPREGESIYDYYTRNPGGHAGDYLPNQGEASPGTPSQINAARPEFWALEHPNVITNDPTLPSDLKQQPPSFWSEVKSFMDKHPAAWNYAATGAAMLGAPPALALAIKAVPKVWQGVQWFVNRFGSNNNQPGSGGTGTTPPPSAPPPDAP